MRTDAGNAELFARLFADELRYDHRRGSWFRWNGHIWTPDKDSYVMRCAKRVARVRMKCATTMQESDDRTNEVKWALSSEATYRLKALLEQAKATEPLADAGEGWDGDPLLFAVENGVIQLSDGRLRAGRPNDRITMQSPVPFDPSAPCRRWEQFLHEIFAGDGELIHAIQLAVGYCLTGLTLEQCLFLCYGDGSNGKSTFLKIIGYVLGDHAHNLPFSAFEVNRGSGIPNDIAPLAGKRFITALETSETKQLNEARIKLLTGEDPVSARFLYGEYFTFRPVGKFWLSFNHKPSVVDDSHGFWRRIWMVPFTQTFSDRTKDPFLESKLRAEAPGILAWAIRGCLEWQRIGLPRPSAVERATREYRTENDIVGEFVEERCEIASGVSVLSADLWKAYEEWTADQDGRPIPR